MKTKANKPAATEQAWPTLGTKVARETRRKMSNLTDEQRDEYFRQGMVLAYGGELKEAGAGHKRGA
jgi:hypothetical protein